MMKRIEILFVLIFSVTFLNAQEKKPDCKPKSCNVKDKKACTPGETKVGEAHVINELRNEVQFVKSLYDLDGNLAIGETDDANLNILLEEIKELSSLSGVDFPKLVGTKAQIVAILRKQIEVIKSK